MKEKNTDVDDDLTPQMDWRTPVFDEDSYKFHRVFAVRMKKDWILSYP